MKITKTRLKEIIKEEVEKVLKEMDTKMSCEMKGGKWHAKEGVCSFGDEHQRPGQLDEEELDELMDSGPMHPADDGRDLRPKKKDEDK